MFLVDKSTESSTLFKGRSKVVNSVVDSQPKQRKQALRKKDTKADHVTRDMTVDRLKYRFVPYV